MPSSHLILCRPLLLLPPIPPSIRVFSKEPTLCMRWPKYWSFTHVSKVLLKILQAELPEVQVKFRKDRRTRDQIANIHWIIEKAGEFQKNIYFCFIDYSKAFDCVDHNKLWKILQEVGIPDHLTCLFRNLYAGQEATVRTAHGTTDWFQIGKGVHQGCILSPFTGVQPQLDPGIPSGGQCRRLRIASVERIRGLIVIGLHGKSIYPHAPITLA